MREAVRGLEPEAQRRAGPGDRRARPGCCVDADAPDGGRWQQSFLGAPSIRIAGGSDEIQRNVMGERVLGLPAEPRVDKDDPVPGARDGRTGRSPPVQLVARSCSPEQQERRRRLIDAAFELGAEGGYDAVQMRSVSATANVAWRRSTATSPPRTTSSPRR